MLYRIASEFSSSGRIDYHETAYPGIKTAEHVLRIDMIKNLCFYINATSFEFGGDYFNFIEVRRRPVTSFLGLMYPSEISANNEKRFWDCDFYQLEEAVSKLKKYGFNFSLDIILKDFYKESLMNNKEAPSQDLVEKNLKGYGFGYILSQ